MKFKTILFPLLIVLLFVWGCTDDVTNYYEGDIDGRVIGSVHGVITDHYTNDRLEGITVTWALKGEVKTTMTNSLGYYAITNLSPGQYELTFSGSDFYAVSRCGVTVNDLAALGIDEYNTEEDFHVSIREDIDLYKKNAALTGLVYAQPDGETRTIAAGVTVIADYSDQDLSGEDYTAVTDATGTYFFADVPATATVDLRSMPFSDGTYDFGVQYLNNVALIPNDTVLASEIIATIAAAAPIMLVNNFENNDFGLTEDIAITFSKEMNTTTFDITLSSGAYGNVEFLATWTNNITLTIDPYVTLQANATYDLSIEGMSMDNNVFDEDYAFNTVEGIKFVSTNLERIDGLFDEFAVDADITITFDMPVDIDHINGYVYLYDADPRLVLATVTLSEDLMTVTVNPNGNLEPGQDYSLNYRVYSDIEGDFDNSSIGFSTAETVTVPGQVTGFVNNELVGWTADWATTQVDLKWNAVAGATSYTIYAKDNNTNSDFVMISSIAFDDYVTSQTTTTTLPASFDYYDDDEIVPGVALQTPFLFGTVVQYGITAWNTAGESVMSTLITVEDETAPTAGALNQTGSANGGVDTFTIEFNSTGEYLDDTEPTVVITDGGGVDVLTSDLITFEWDADMKGGTFTIDNSAGADFTGDTFIVSVFNDTSGNMNTVTVQTVLF